MDLRKLKTLLDLFESSNLQEMEFCEGEERVKLTKPSAVSVAPQALMTNMPVAQSTDQQTLPPESLERSGQIVESPMVGTFYRSSSPEKPPFVQKGDKVSKGQTLCIIEAMKLMNEIASTANGTVKEILIENGNPIAYGTPLFLID